MEELKALLLENLVLADEKDEALLEASLMAAIAYAKGYQKKDELDLSNLNEATRHGILLLATFLYESRDGVTGGFFSNQDAASSKTFESVHLLLQIDKDWRI